MTTEKLSERSFEYQIRELKEALKAIDEARKANLERALEAEAWIEAHRWLDLGCQGQLDLLPIIEAKDKAEADVKELEELLDAKVAQPLKTIEALEAEIETLRTEAGQRLYAGELTVMLVERNKLLGERLSKASKWVEKMKLHPHDDPSMEGTPSGGTFLDQDLYDLIEILDNGTTDPCKDCIVQLIDVKDKLAKAQDILDRNISFAQLGVEENDPEEVGWYKHLLGELTEVKEALGDE